MANESKRIRQAESAPISDERRDATTVESSTQIEPVPADAQNERLQRQWQDAIEQPGYVHVKNARERLGVQVQPNDVRLRSSNDIWAMIEANTPDSRDDFWRCVPEQTVKAGDSKSIPIDTTLNYFRNANMPVTVRWAELEWTTTSVVPMPKRWNQNPMSYGTYKCSTNCTIPNQSDDHGPTGFQEFVPCERNHVMLPPGINVGDFSRLGDPQKCRYNQWHHMCKHCGYTVILEFPQDYVRCKSAGCDDCFHDLPGDG